MFDTGVLPAGRHYIRIEWTGLKNAAATGTFIGIDAFSLTGSAAQVAVRREQEASPVAYTGTWSTWADPVLSGGSYTYANAAGASVTTTIVGSGFALIARTGPEFGRARIYVDGVAEDIDLYSPTTRYQQTVLTKTLPYGMHTVKVEWTGTKNAASTGTNVNIDAIDVFTAEPGGALSFDAANRVVGFTYDARGNVLSDGTHTYTWDAMNRLTGVKLATTGAPVASYAYDADGMRQVATVGASTTRFVVDSLTDEIVALLDSAGAVVTRFVRDAAGALVAMARSGATLTYLTNAHGDVTALVSSTGAVVARWTYDAWGVPTEYSASGVQVALGTAGNPFLFAGYYYDTATGHYYLRARYYDPATGRFLSMDPEPGGMTDRLSQNPYIYCQNDPVNLADPDGRAVVQGTGVGPRLNAWQKAQIAALRAKKAAEAARKAAAARLAAARKAAAAKLAAAKNAVKKAAATTAGVGKSLAFYAKNTVHKPKEGTADYTRYYSMQAKMYNTMADAFDTGAKVAKVALAAVIVTEVVLVSIWAAPLVTAGAQAVGAAHTAGVAASGTASAVGGATVRELTDGEFEDEKNIASVAQKAVELPQELAGGNANVNVYVGNDLKTGITRYIGITNNLARRAAEHVGRLFGVDLANPVAESVTRGEARCIEQAVIHANNAVKSGAWDNAINSISPGHAYYDQAVAWGTQWLQNNGGGHLLP